MMAGCVGWHHSYPPVKNSNTHRYNTLIQIPESRTRQDKVPEATHVIPSTTRPIRITSVMRFAGM
jgi:hypothetical protein